MKSKVERLESQNSVLKEKSSDIRSENDRLVAKIQKLQSRISQEVGEILSMQCPFCLRFECQSLSTRMATLMTSSTLVQARPNQEHAALNLVSR